PSSPTRRSSDLAHGNTTLTAGTVVAVTTLQSRLFQPIAQTLTTATEVSGSVALFNRIFDYLDLKPDITDRPGARSVVLSDVHGQVRLDDVWFSYEPDLAGDTAATWALQGVDLVVRPGRLAALVGASGAGKTTISYLVPRLYDPTRGTVSLDGTDLRDFTQESIADAVGMVTQESYLFHATIRDNIAFGRPDAPLDQVEEAARAANIHDRIMEFEDGYDTVVGERGYRLSGGEKQRLAIARVLLKDPAVVILDEATAHLDSETELLVQQALAAALAGRTSIVIAHRLSTIQAADQILVVDGGEIVARGTHEELIGQGGLYAELYQT